MVGKHSTSPRSRRHDRPAVRLDDIGSLVQQKRQVDHLSLEQAAAQAGVSAATLWRLERRAMATVGGKEMPTPDTRTLAAITDWLGVAVAGAGFAPVAPTAMQSAKSASVPDTVEAHLRADPKLDPVNAALLARIFRAAYAQFTEDDPTDSNRREQGSDGDVPEKDGE